MKNQHFKAAFASFVPLTILFFLMPGPLTAGGNGLPAVSKTTATCGNWAPDKQLKIDLYGISAGNTESLADGFRVRFNDGYLPAISDDIVKMMNFGENISTYRENRDLVIEKRPLISIHDTIYLHFTNANMVNYIFKINTVNFESCGLRAFIQDSYTNQTIDLTLDGSINSIGFKITADPASTDPFRFKLVFGPSAVLPVTLTGFKAAWQQKQVAVHWQVSNQINMKRYDVERSTNGTVFSTVNTQAVSGNNGSSASYTWVDANPAGGNSFYRIRCIGIGGDITLSPVISIKVGTGVADIGIFPNPVSNGSFALQLTDMEKGSYQLRLFNNSGQLLFTKTINHTGSNSTYAIMPGNGVVRGNYYLEIGGEGAVIRKQLMVVE